MQREKNMKVKNVIHTREEENIHGKETTVKRKPKEHENQNVNKHQKKQKERGKKESYGRFCFEISKVDLR